MFIWQNLFQIYHIFQNTHQFRIEFPFNFRLNIWNHFVIISFLQVYACFMCTFSENENFVYIILCILWFSLFQPNWRLQLSTLLLLLRRWLTFCEMKVEQYEYMHKLVVSFCLKRWLSQLNPKNQIIVLVFLFSENFYLHSIIYCWSLIPIPKPSFLYHVLFLNGIRYSRTLCHTTINYVRDK